jgi:hypothetical protein
MDAMDHSIRIFRNIIAALSGGHRRRRLLSVACVLVLAAIAGTDAIVGTVPTYYYGHDIFAMLDAGWRFVCGQVAHVDYASWWGPIPSVVFGTGLILTHNSVAGFGYGLALASFTLGACTWVLCRRRMYPVPAVLASLGIALLAAAPFPVGLRLTTLSHAMSYNRWGYALLAIILFEAFTSSRDEKDALAGGVIAGAACAAALFLKASYFFVGIAFLGASLLASRSLRRLVGIVVGAAAVSFGFLAYLHFDVRDMIADLAIAGRARKASITFWVVRWSVIDQIPQFLPLFAAAVLLVLDPWHRRSERLAARFSATLASVLLLFGGGLLLASNAQATGFPLIALFAIVLLNEVLRRGADPEEAVPYRCAIILLAAICFLPRLMSDASGLMYGLVQHGKPAPASVVRFHPPHLQKLVLMDVQDARDWETRSNGAAYVAYINDGVDLVQTHSKPSETVMTFDIHDPLPYALLRRPPEGGSISMGYGHGFTDHSKLSPERFFGNADIVMFPKYPAAPDTTFAALRRIYGPYLESHFRSCVESERWVLYRRTGTSAECLILSGSAP